MAADSDSEDDDESSVRGSIDGGAAPRPPPRDNPNAGPIGGPLSGGLTIPASMNDPGGHLLPLSSFLTGVDQWLAEWAEQYSTGPVDISFLDQFVCPHTHP